MINVNIDGASTIQSRTGVVTGAGDILQPNPNRRTLVIQNLNTAPLFVKFGTGATSSDFDFVLAAGTGADDGLGGIFSEDVLSYTGIISVAGTTVRCTATEL